MKEEIKIKEKLQGREPFKVPENYFENFTSELMDKLPEQEPMQPEEITLWTKVRPWIYMAAMFVGIMLSVRVFVGSPQKNNMEQLAASIDDMSDEYLNEMVDGTLMDDYSLYEYLTEASLESAE